MEKRIKLIGLACKTHQLKACIEEQVDAQRARVGQELDYLVGRYTVAAPLGGRAS